MGFTTNSNVIAINRFCVKKKEQCQLLKLTFDKKNILPQKYVVFELNTKRLQTSKLRLYVDQFSSQSFKFNPNYKYAQFPKQFKQSRTVLPALNKLNSSLTILEFAKGSELRRAVQVFVIIKSYEPMKLCVLRQRSNGQSFIARFYLIYFYCYMSQFMRGFITLAVAIENKTQHVMFY